jgi:pimeloyl-ACP methyl ester carboxylesterase
MNGPSMNGPSREALSIAAQGFVFNGLTSGPVDGRPVILLHGFPETSWSWRSQLVALGDAGYRAIAFDQRGYSSGARPTDVSAYHIDNLVADVIAVADVLGIDRFDLVGHDWGGMVAWATAYHHPQRLRSVTVLSTPHPTAFGAALSIEGGDQQQKSGYIGVFRQEGVAEKLLLGEDGSGAGLRVLFDSSGFATDDADVFVKALTEPGALTAALNWYRATEIHSIGGVGEIAIPTMYVWSTDDIALGREAAEATGSHVTGPYRFEVLDGVSHWIPEMAPDTVNELLLDFLGSQSS